MIELERAATEKTEARKAGSSLISPKNVERSRKAMIRIFEATLEPSPFEELCEVDCFELPSAHDQGLFEVYFVRAKKSLGKTGLKAYVYCHGGGAALLDAKYSLNDAFQLCHD